MSYNPWPLVLVALGSLGFLANSMAQNNDRFEGNGAARRFADGQLQVRRSSSEATDLEQPNFGAGSGSVALESFDRFADSLEDRVTRQRREPLRQPSLRRDVSEARSGRQLGVNVEQDPEAIITDVRSPEPSSLRTSPFSSRLPGSRPIETQVDMPSTTRLAQNAAPSGNRGALDFPGIPRRSTPRQDPRTRPAAGNFAKDIEDAYLDPERDLEFTKSTSLVEGSRDLIDNLGTNPRNVNTPLKEAAETSSLGAETVDTLQKAIGNVSAPKSVPFWLTLALFISLPANLFFGWIAMSMHARYQDLLEDMHASESRLNRESRRRRPSERDELPRSTSDASPRRLRDDDEEAFLRGGIEV